jgi:hypothetical protein
MRGCSVKELHRPERFPGALVVFPGISGVPFL